MTDDLQDRWALGVKRRAVIQGTRLIYATIGSPLQIDAISNRQEGGLVTRNLDRCVVLLPN